METCRNACCQSSRETVFAEAKRLRSKIMAEVKLVNLKKIYPNTEKKKKAKKGEEEKKNNLQITD